MSEYKTWFVIYDNWTDQFLISTFNGEDHWEHDLSDLKDDNYSGIFSTKHLASKRISRLEVEFVEYGTPESEIDFEVIEIVETKTYSVVYSIKDK
jgi:hypothetical protein